MATAVDIRQQILALQMQISELIDQLDEEENASPNLTPAETIEVPDPHGARHILWGWMGLGDGDSNTREGRLFKYRFDDGPLGPLIYQSYPRGLAKDWDVIARGCKDATGELYAPYNFPSYKPAWNILDIEGNRPADDVIEQRYRDYKGGLRSKVESWPEKNQALWKKAGK
jgi:hypothetical protein